jgi:hypothetical protein
MTAIEPRRAELAREGHDADSTADLAPLPARVAQAVTAEAIDRALGDEVSPAVKKEIAERIAPWAERLAYYLDDWIRIPGTNVRFGLDAVVGLIPGVGDVVTGTGSIALLLLALKRGVPTAGLLRMVLNIGVDVLGGALPVVGDAFDVAWRSNRKNLDIIKRYAEDPDAEPTAGDKLFVGIGIALAILSILVPLLVGAWLGAGIYALFG